MKTKRTRNRHQQLRAQRRQAALSCPRYPWFTDEPAGIAAAHEPPAAAGGCSPSASGVATVLSAEAQSPAPSPPPPLRRFEMVAYRGGRMRPQGFSLPVVVDLAGCQVAAGDRPSFLQHDPTKIVGHISRITVDRVVTCSGVISGVGQAAREVVETADRGFPWRASIGGPIDKLVFVEDGETVQANGQSFTGPLFVIRQMTLLESSFVALAGDDSSAARILAGRFGAHELESAQMTFSQWLAAAGFDESKLTDQQQKSLRAMYDAEMAEAEGAEGQQNTVPASAANTQLGAGGTTTTPATSPTQVTAGAVSDPAITADQLRAQLAAASAAELLRQSEIHNVCGQYGVTTADIDGQQVQLEAHAVRHQWTRERTELAALRAARPQTGPAIHDGTVPREIFAEALEASICLAHQVPQTIAAESISDRAMQEATSRRMRGLGLHAIMHECIRAAGGYYRPGQVDTGFVEAALRADAQLRAAGASTFSLSGILSNSGYKRLLAAYRAVPLRVHDLAARANHKDFKAVDSYRMTGLGMLTKIGPDGQMDSMELGEDKYTNQVDSYGRILALTFPKIKNDDLGAFMDIMKILGRAGAKALLKAVYTLINGGVTANFFSAGNKNYFSGAATNLQISSLQTALQKFRDQVDADGDPIDLEPAVLAVGSWGEVLAGQIFSDAFLALTTTADKPSPESNPFQGKFRPHVAPQLNNTALGGTDTGWGLFADPNDIAAFSVAYLDGVETPTIEFSEADFDVLGMKWRSTFHFGAAYADPKAAVWSKGAA